MTTEFADKAVNSRWWGSFDLPRGDWSCWTVGQLKFYICSDSKEWSIAWSRAGYALNTDVSYQLGGCPPVESDSIERSRFIAGGDSTLLDLDLQLADRAMVARPETPIFIAVGECVNLYISSGIWLQCRVADKILVDIPVNRPSDTWFGPNTTEGELCYFSLTRARTSQSEVTVYPHRATTKVTVVNQSENLLRIERLRVPTQLLNLYSNDQAELVTDSLTYNLKASGTKTEIKIERLSELDGVSCVSSARIQDHDNLVTEAFSRIFS